MWRCAFDRTEAASRSALPRKRLAARANQPARRIAVLHQLQQRTKFFWGQGEVFPDGGKAAPVTVLVTDAEHDQPAEDGFGFLVPMRFRHLARRVHHQRLRQRRRIFAQIETVRRQAVERVVGG